MTDPTTTKRVIEFISSLSPLLWLIVGGLVAHLWNRFRTRTRRFVWRAWHQQIAIAANNPQFGTVTVQYKGIPVNHVHATVVEVINDSNEDQKDVAVTLSFQGVGHIANSSGQIEGALGALPFDPDYVALFAGATPAQIALLNTWVIHRIPVFNRRQKAIFNLLVIRDDATAPIVVVSCVHPGVKLVNVPAAVMEIDGVPLNLASATGLLLTAGATVGLAFLSQRQLIHLHSDLIAAIAWIFGIFSARIGAASVNVWRVLARWVG